MYATRLIHPKNRPTACTLRTSLELPLFPLGVKLAEVVVSNPTICDTSSI